MDNERVIKSYVWHNGKCFFVSTIERDSSSAISQERFNETIVWDYDWEKNERHEMIHQDWAPKGSITTHNRICLCLYYNGSPEKPTP